MKEIKTCEEYVLNELEEKKAQVKRMAETCKDFMDVMETVDGFLDVLKRFLKLRRSADGNRVIDMNLIFEQYEPEEFKIMIEMLDLKEDT